ncbi:hypothetical protein TVAG_349530 [Trichomonas vaginalis G3]|uniref:Uncharacterized protein n=1 Tax=Trichomonas vaginalis (strain ATCC PRA-98 / G3) TaxID=412133 RepID=A2EMN0_TRIV3|nr:transport protein TRAPP family [Trichomonas vaginalis G3]EAY06100.1 hypothetical protein TVAG_349530 [Trichomonas vaginalis G3]KAI5497152.1 transport protein TRAPP family [Trichomonas vaginalis G3]|eukprot:XP_001318323.1 hypothetical protein [Trichomonas vaginalis G3]
MKSAEHVYSFKARQFIKQRFAPIIVGFVDTNAEKAFAPTGVSFSDFFAGLCTAYQEPIRYYDVTTFVDAQESTFFESIKNDTTKYGQLFIPPQFEKEASVDTNNVKLECPVPKKLLFGSEDTRFTPWYKNFIHHLCESIKIKKYEFCDIPFCLLYVSTAQSPNIDNKSVRKMIPIPSWMAPFISDIPVGRIIIYDPIVTPNPPKINKSDQSFVFPLPVKSKPDETQSKSDFYKKYFSHDPNIVNALTKSQIIGNNEIAKTLEIISVVYRGEISPLIQRQINDLKEKIEKTKKVSNRLRGIFKKKSDTEKQGELPETKTNQLRLAALYMITGQYPEAEKLFKHISQHNPLLKLQISAKFWHNLACFAQNNFNFSNSRELCEEVFKSNDIRFILYTFIVLSEIYHAENNNDSSINVMNIAIAQIKQNWEGLEQTINLILALFYERLSGLQENEKRILYSLAQAAEMYMQALQHGHCLRCTIWLINCLPHDSWPYLYQRALLNKAISLNFLNEVIRAILDCKELLEMDGLQEALQERTISQFWTPFNNPSFDPSKFEITFSPLVGVKKVVIITPSDPEYWGFLRDDFQNILDAFVKIKEEWEKLYGKTLTIESWMSNKTETKEEIYEVSTGCNIKVLIQLSNKYVFGVNLTKAELVAEFTPENKEENCDDSYKTNPAFRVDIPSRKAALDGVSKVLPLDFVCKKTGVFKINKFQMQSWGCVETSVTFEPAIIKASDSFPLITMSIENLPNELVQGICVRFSVKIVNNGTKTVSGLTLGFDHPNSIAYEGNVDYHFGIASVNLEEKIEPGKSICIPMIFRAAKVNINRVHFYLSHSQTIVSLTALSVKVNSSVSIYSRIIPFAHDTSKFALKVKFDPKVDGLTIVGVFDKTGKLLKTLHPNPASLVQKESSATIVYYADQHNEEFVLEPWRLFMLEQNSYAMLFKVEGNELLAQQNMRIHPDNSQMVRISAPTFVKFTPGVSVNVSLKIESENPVFVQPKDIELLNDEKNQITPIMPARWTGVTRKCLNAENQFSANFTFNVYLPGIYSITGFMTSENKEFAMIKDLSILHLIRVSENETK